MMLNKIYKVCHLLNKEAPNDFFYFESNNTFFMRKVSMTERTQIACNTIDNYEQEMDYMYLYFGTWLCSSYRFNHMMSDQSTIFNALSKILERLVKTNIEQDFLKKNIYRFNRQAHCKVLSLLE